MITSAEGFIALRNSTIKAEYDRAAMEEAPLSVWRAVLKSYPDYMRWVVHNKTVPLEILEELCSAEPESKRFVASKRKLSQSLFESLSEDSDSVVRCGIACNRKTPLDILEKLSLDEDEAEDEDEDVADAARRNFASRKK
jgi:hypothetical protein